MPQLLLRLQPVGSRRTIVLPGEERPSAGERTPVARWSATIGDAHEPAVVVDAAGTIRGISDAACDLLTVARAEVMGRAFLDAVEPIDFYTGEAPAEYADRVPPLIVLKTGGLQRGLLRVQRAEGGPLTLDAVATPLHDAAGNVAGSLTFFAAVTPG